MDYFPPSEGEGGWQVGEPCGLGVDTELLRRVVSYHCDHSVTRSYGGALVVVYRGHVIADSYVTGELGGPQPWGRETCNDVKSSTKSVFGTAVGVFLDEYRGRVGLETPLVGASCGESLLPQIWDQPLTDGRKAGIRVKHVLSMTLGHESKEPWLAPGRRCHTPEYAGPYQMYEYCFGWWGFDGVPAQRRLLFEPGVASTTAISGWSRWR